MSLFVPLNEPDEVRRELLNCSKQVLGTLRRYEHYREIRKAKLDAFSELAKTWADMEKIQRKLKSVLPKTDIKPIAMPRVNAPMPAVSEKQKIREHKTKIQMLEDQLAKIEDRLGTLK
jgi:polyhydroxyalkanoate synthesis regulator phasin